ncbi:MAG TPA: serine/threonine-protein kinase [Actinomadura sp.]|jgi:tRNA A-37 threonylcarbamoyl transferase component Bud32|nr:serine/threonine-protein kinase [Actinomadura sp.]
MPTSVGRYRIDHVLGSGAFASVWLGHDDALAVQVAIKVLSGSLLDDLDVRNRFLEEARILRRADSDRLVRVHDIGELPDGRPYFVMSYADGGTLADRMRHRPLPVKEALAMAEDIAYGVEVIHRLGIIHRDLKPSNVLFHSTADGGERLLIADLGLAKALAHASGSFTLPVGTPGYMSPEQMRFGGGLDVRADVYGLGALTYHMLTGRPPAPAPVKSPPSSLRPELGPEYDQVILRALAPQRENRWPTAEAFAHAITTLPPPSGAVATSPRSQDGTPGPPPSPVPSAGHGTPGPPPGTGPQAAPADGATRAQDGIPTVQPRVHADAPAGETLADGGPRPTAEMPEVREARSDGTVVLPRPPQDPPRGHGDHGPGGPAGPGPGPSGPHGGPYGEPHGGPGSGGPPGPPRADGPRDARKLLVPGAIAAGILAVAVLGGLLSGTFFSGDKGERSKPKPDPNFVTVSDASGKLTATVPKAWPEQSQRTWEPSEVALADAQPRPVLRATPDFTGFRTTAGKTPGVFIGMTTDVTPGKLPPPSAAQHSRCTKGRPEGYARGSLKGTVTRFTGCATGTPSITEIGLTDTGGRFGVWIRIKQLEGKDLTEQILDSVVVKGP